MKRSTSRLVIGGTAIGATGLALAAVVAITTGTNATGDGKIEQRDVSCRDGLHTSAHFDYDSHTKSDASPAELANRWAESQKLHDKFPDASLVFVDQSEPDVEMAFIQNDEAVSVLHFGKHPDLGWRLQTVTHCNE